MDNKFYETDETFKDGLEAFDTISKSKETKKDNPYGFKFYFNDGTTLEDGGIAKRPEDLYLDFDGLLEWNEYYALSNKHLTTKEILEMAMGLYKHLKKNYFKIEIVNYQTGEVIDYIERKER